jgi:hypothetical protein
MALPVELSVGTIFRHDDYIIPLYQRNYAWEQAQVTQLIRDIWDYKEENTNYYIGSLVVHSRQTDDNKLVFETIDGQQRLTTLNILLSVLKHEFKTNVDYRHESRLKFDSRAVSSDTLKILADHGKAYNKAHTNTRMEQAYLDMAKELRQLTKNKKYEVEVFANYLLNRVKILRVEVPWDTDLNHYFEIMNNRGEQLEKHEILKAEFLSHLKDNPEASLAFAKVWDACSNMERYMVMEFKKDVRDALFKSTDKTWNYFPADFDEVTEKLNRQNNEVNEVATDISFLDLIEAESLKVNYEEEVKEEDPSRFTSVINFPNFLLHVLRVHTGKDIALDDKRLIPTFKKVIEKATNKAQFTIDFAYALLRSRFMFDKYVIKREFTQNGDSWSLKSLKISKKDTAYYANTFADEGKNKQALMLLSMFHVSFPQIIYKHWLSGVLHFLRNKPAEINIDDFVKYLESLSAAFYYDKFGENEVDFYEIIFKNNAERVNQLIDERYLHGGTDVQNFIFNRLDYLLWKSEVTDQEGRFKIDNVNQFEFSFRSSVEHYYPQNPKPGAVSKLLPKEVLDSFGNLCLISRNKNSELSNYSPLAKAEHYAKSSTIESLKQQLMMRQKDNWDEIAIEKHGIEMIELLCS